MPNYFVDRNMLAQGYSVLDTGKGFVYFTPTNAGDPTLPKRVMVGDYTDDIRVDVFRDANGNIGYHVDAEQRQEIEVPINLVEKPFTPLSMNYLWSDGAYRSYAEGTPPPQVKTVELPSMTYLWSDGSKRSYPEPLDFFAEDDIPSMYNPEPIEERIDAPQVYLVEDIVGDAPSTYNPEPIEERIDAPLVYIVEDFGDVPSDNNGTEVYLIPPDGGELNRDPVPPTYDQPIPPPPTGEPIQIAGIKLDKKTILIGALLLILLVSRE